MENFFGLLKIERVTNIISENYEGNVYNIEVEGNHNYFVTSSNILVHNKY
jgi:intein/homing endonuclease